jgi:hypothetical protein
LVFGLLNECIDGYQSRWEAKTYVHSAAFIDDL